MGRVDEAMRRAAEARQQNGPDAGTKSEGPTQSGRGGFGPSEVFVSEVGDRTSVRAIGSTPDGGSARRDVPFAPVPVPVPASSPASVIPPLSERLEAGLTGKVVIGDGMDATSREQYRKMAATLHALQAESGVRVIMVASAMANEGKTLTAANLAMTLSESYQRNVLLIDGDLRKPSQHTVFGIALEPGLGEGVNESNAKLMLHRVSPTLTVIPAGHPTDDPMATLASERMKRLIVEAREDFDWVLIDTPPIGLLSDASLIAAEADGTILVVKADDTPYDLVQRAVAALGRERILGVVLNLASPSSDGRYGTPYGYYARGQAPTGKG